jgi:NADH-quinone oxidoreductase subunit M
MGGLWVTVPRMGAAALLFALASLGLPGLGNFVAEFLVLLGAFRVNVWLTSLATLGLIAATVYALWMIQAAFHGPRKVDWKIQDLTGREIAMMAAMTLVIVLLGLYPQPVVNTANQALGNLPGVAQAETSAPRPATLRTIYARSESIVVAPEAAHDPR